MPDGTEVRRNQIPAQGQGASDAKLDPAPPAELVDSIRAGDCVLFAGAGLGARAGVPTWNQFLEQLRLFALENQIISDSDSDSFVAALKNGDRDSVADGLVQAFGEKRQMLQDFLRRSFPEPTSLSTAHRRLAQIPFATVVTTNYDTLLEKAFPDFAQSGLFTPKDAEALLDALSQRRQFILKLYGIIERPDTLIFAPIEYREVIASNLSFSKFVEGFFFSRSFLFIGLSLEGIQDFLSGFVFRGTARRRHFALVAVSGKAWKSRANLLKRRYNIEVLSYPVTETFVETDTFIENLLTATGPQQTESSAPRTQPAALKPGIRKLILEDIGPFERLEVDFSPDKNWKVLLGDNGVGKSTALKAIATAIIGSDARSYAARLVRAGKTRGRITLLTEENPHGYVTDILTKDMVSESEVVSIPTRCLEAEGWLALGFSPLRVVTWNPSSGPQSISQKGRPTSDDLIPLISGETDPRMDRLKQWIVNLDATAKPTQLRALTGHTDTVSSIVFSPDGRSLISGSIDKTIRIWDSWTGQELRKIDGHTGGVNAVAVSADGKVIVSGSFDTTVKLWGADTGVLLKTLGDSHSQILGVAVSGDGTTVVSGSEGGSARVGYSYVDAGSLRMTTGKAGAVWSVAVSKDGQTVIAGFDLGSLTVSDTAVGPDETVGRERQVIAVPGGGIWSVGISDDARLIIAASESGSVTLWATDTGLPIRTLQPGRSCGALCAALSSDGRTAAAGWMDGVIKVWDVETGRELLMLQAHTAAVWSVALGPDGRTLASASADKSIKLWNVPASTTSRQYETIRKFFQLVGELIDRKDIQFSRVTENFRVMVRVAEVGEEIPLEVLSQGLTSLIGWVGVLCQRLSETAPNPDEDPLPTNTFALVLIDELDAHMHPRWQQMLVQRLKRVFPNVQFVACTHSPLIVGGLDAAEVERFAIEDGKVVKVEFDPDMTLGRTDQILTSELFNLSSTLDVATQELMAEYETLLGKSTPEPSEIVRLTYLQEQLENRIPPSPSGLVDRRARELLSTLQSINLSLLETDSRKKLDDRIVRLSRALAREERP
jgi:WD40 repeat protein